MKDYFTKKEQIAILICVLVVIFYIGFKFVSSNLLGPKKDSPEIVNQDLQKEEELYENPPNTEIEEEETIIMVHISGQVNQPGLIELKSGSRVKDAVDLAGGLKKDADIDRINLAKKLLDEEKIYVPQIDEQVDTEVTSIDLNTPGNTNTNTSTTSKININNCSKEELMQLPGIGEVTASKIIDYRTDNQFRAIEDIMNVSGIGVKKFEAIQELIITN